jgi:hypothetical protein
MSPSTFDEFVKANWPKDVSADCTNLKPDEVTEETAALASSFLHEMLAESDCLERNETTLCESCKTYARLAEEWEKKSGERIDKAG